MIAIKISLAHNSKLSLRHLLSERGGVVGGGGGGKEALDFYETFLKVCTDKHIRKCGTSSGRKIII